MFYNISRKSGSLNSATFLISFTLLLKAGSIN